MLVSLVSRAVRLFVSRLLGPVVLHVLWSLVCRMSGSLAGQASSFSHVVCSVFRVRLGLSTFSVCPYIRSFVCLFVVHHLFAWLVSGPLSVSISL